jgi:putative peptidoglycan lipid II flippase
VRARETALGAEFLRFFLPQVPLYLVGMVARAMLNAAGRLITPVLSPAYASACMIASYIVFWRMGSTVDVFSVTRRQILVLAAGATGGVLLWSLAQVLAMWRTGFRYRPVLLLRDPAVTGALRASVHGMGLYVVMQIGLMITLILANRVPGGVVAFYLAYAFYELPNALVGFPLSMVAVPSLARSALLDDMGSFASLLSRTWRTAAVFITPAAAGLVVTAPALSRLIFAHGRSQGTSADLVAMCLIGLAVGLPAFALSQGVVRTLYARRDTAAPISFMGIWVLTYGLSAGILTFTMHPRGATAMLVIGAAHALGQWAGLGGGVMVLRRRVPRWDVGPDVAHLVRAVLRSALMGAVVWVMLRESSRFGESLALAVAIAGGVSMYALLVLSSRTDRESLGVGRGRV